MRFTVSPEVAARMFLLSRCGDTHTEDVDALAKLLIKIELGGFSTALEKAKEIYRTLYSGGCMMPSRGSACRCFLCQCDDLLGMEKAP